MLGLRSPGQRRQECRSVYVSVRVEGFLTTFLYLKRLIPLLLLHQCDV